MRKFKRFQILFIILLLLSIFVFIIYKSYVENDKSLYDLKYIKLEVSNKYNFLRINKISEDKFELTDNNFKVTFFFNENMTNKPCEEYIPCEDLSMQEKLQYNPVEFNSIDISSEDSILLSKSGGVISNGSELSVIDPQITRKYSVYEIIDEFYVTEQINLKDLKNKNVAIYYEFISQDALDNKEKYLDFLMSMLDNLSLKYK